MHELGLLFEVTKRVLQVLEDEHLHAVDTIVLQVGEASGVVPRYLKECFDAAASGTVLESSKLEIELSPAMVRCNSCGYSYELSKNRQGCPKCGEMRNSLVSGREFLIKEIVAK